MARSAALSGVAVLPIGMVLPQPFGVRLQTIEQLAAFVLHGTMYGFAYVPAWVASEAYAPVGSPSRIEGVVDPPWQDALAHCHGPVDSMFGKMSFVQLTEQVPVSAQLASRIPGGILDAFPAPGAFGGVLA